MRPLTHRERLALLALDKAPDAVLYATNKPQNDVNLNASVARRLHERGLIQPAPGWLAARMDGAAVPWIFTDAGALLLTIKRRKAGC